MTSNSDNSTASFVLEDVTVCLVCASCYCEVEAPQDPATVPASDCPVFPRHLLVSWVLTVGMVGVQAGPREDRGRGLASHTSPTRQSQCFLRCGEQYREPLKVVGWLSIAGSLYLGLILHLCFRTGTPMGLQTGC